MMLHTVNKSPSEKPSLQSCLRLASAGSDILLIEDGVYVAVYGTKFSKLVERSLKSHQVYALEADLECRGLDKSQLIDGVEVIDYKGFVSLAVRNKAIHSWL